jgi:4-hydroxybenzoate polyprenyltransferase
MAYKIKFKHRLKIYQGLLGILIIFMIVATCYAATTEPSWAEHLDLVTVLISGLFIIISYFIIRTLRTFERNQDLLFDKYNNFEKRLSHIEGAHEARTGQGKRC